LQSGIRFPAGSTPTRQRRSSMGYNGWTMATGPKENRQLILAFTEDLFLQPRLQDAAAALGYDLQVIEQPQAFGGEAAELAPRPALTEPLAGLESMLVRRLSSQRPALLLFDLSSQHLPWQHWIQVLKTSAATRRIPLVAFGPHVEEAALEAARAAGADQVLTRGQLQRGLARVLQTWAERPVEVELQQGCAGSLSALAVEGIALHNRGAYFEAHEKLEHAWLQAGEFEGYLYRALLQVSVAHLHLANGNLAGAVKLLMRVHRWLDPLPDTCRGVELASLRDSVGELRATLYRALDEGRPTPARFQPIVFRVPGQTPEKKVGGEP